MNQCTQCGDESDAEVRRCGREGHVREWRKDWMDGWDQDETVGLLLPGVGDTVSFLQFPTVLPCSCSNISTSSPPLLSLINISPTRSLSSVSVLSNPSSLLSLLSSVFCLLSSVSPLSSVLLKGRSRRRGARSPSCGSWTLV